MKYIFLFLFLLCLPGASLAAGTKIYGLYEQVCIAAISDKAIDAKLDTGATTSSLGADNIEIFEKDDEDWVRFTPQVEGAKQVEFPLARKSRIKMRIVNGFDSTSVKRPVIMLEVCFDGKKHEIEVNLADRTRFKYPLLIGAKALVSFEAIVDPSLKYQAGQGKQ